MQEGYPKAYPERLKPFPKNKFGINTQVLYEAASFFFTAPDIENRFRDHLNISPITPEMMDDLEAYKPEDVLMYGHSAEGLRRHEQEKREQHRASAQKLVELVSNTRELNDFLIKLLPLSPDSPEFEFVSFLQQFSDDTDLAYQLERVFLKIKD